jgi:fucose permease
LLSAPLDESSIKDKQPDSMVKDFTKMFKLLVTPIVLIFICCAFFYVLIEQSIMSWLPTFNNKVLLLPAALSIQMASILAGSTAIGRFLAGLLLKKLNWFIVLVSCLVLAAILVLVAIPLAEKVSGQPITGWSTAPLAAFIFPLIGLLIAPVYPAVNSLILSTLPKQKHGLMSGLIIIFSALGGTTGSIITGHIFESYGGQKAFYFSLIPITILIISLFLFMRLQKKFKSAPAENK